MDRRTTDSLAQFCATQRNDFRIEEWLAWNDIGGGAVALAARYLSMTNWYGHEDELDEIARRGHGQGKSTGLYRESRAIDFDLPYFSARVRVDVARDQLERDAREQLAAGFAAGPVAGTAHVHYPDIGESKTHHE